MKYFPFIYLDIKSNRRLILIFEMIFWPILSIASLGLFTVFTKATFHTKMFLFTGAMGWTIVYLAHYSLGRGFMGSVWFRTLKQIFSSPITFKDLIIGHALYGIISSAIGFLTISLFALSFDFNIFTIGGYLLPIFFLAYLCGVILGMMALSFVILFGLRIDLLVWVIVDVIVFLSGLYYSIAVFPRVVQLLSQFFPVMYIFEAMRSALTGSSILPILAKGYGSAAIWLFLAILLVRKIETYARKIGFYEKYG